MIVEESVTSDVYVRYASIEGHWTELHLGLGAHRRVLCVGRVFLKFGLYIFIYIYIY